MRHELIQIFKGRQIEIFKAEQDLANKTHETLFHLLSVMSEKELKELSDARLEISDYQYIVSFGLDTVTIGEDVLDEEDFYNQSLESLGQVAQKNIIDHILMEIFKV